MIEYSITDMSTNSNVMPKLALLITPTPGSPDTGEKSFVYEVLKPLYGNSSSSRTLHKTMNVYFRNEGFDTIGFEESVWRRPPGRKYVEVIFVSSHL